MNTRIHMHLSQVLQKRAEECMLYVKAVFKKAYMAFCSNADDTRRMQHSNFAVAIAKAIAAKEQEAVDATM